MFESEGSDHVRGMCQRVSPHTTVIAATATTARKAQGALCQSPLSALAVYFSASLILSQPRRGDVEISSPLSDRHRMTTEGSG
jgi:hypothetical protein